MAASIAPALVCIRTMSGFCATAKAGCHSTEATRICARIELGSKPRPIFTRSGRLKWQCLRTRFNSVLINVVILEPRRQLGKYGLSIRTIVNIHLISFEGLDERFCHPIRLRAAHQREARRKAQSHGKLDRLVGTIAAPVIGEPLNGLCK